MEEEKQVQNNEPLTKKEKADIAGKDLAEIAARGAGRYFGGAVGGAAVDAALETKSGQKVIGRTSKIINKNPITRNVLARNQGKIGQVKPFVNSIINSMSNSNYSSVSDMDNLSDSYDELDNSSSNVKGSGIVSGLWKKMPLKTKLIIIGVVASFCFLVFFLVILITPLMELKIIDIEGMGGSATNPSYGYSSIFDNSNYLWPIGSSEKEYSDGVYYALGDPVSTTITSRFGKRTYNGVIEGHGAIDISAGGDINIIASRSGKVISNAPVDCPSLSERYNNCGDGYGNYVILEHGDGEWSVYAHLREYSVLVKYGDTVRQGQVLGLMGSSGDSDGQHLHFEIRDVNGVKVDPEIYVTPK